MRVLKRAAVVGLGIVALASFAHAGTPARIAFAHRIPHRQLADLWIVDADGSHPGRLTRNPGIDTEPSWSPDGRRLAFASTRPDHPHLRQIYVMSADGSGLRRLLERASNDSLPAWSPDGRTIAFVEERGRVLEPELYLVAVDGQGLHALVAGSQPSYAPGGRRLVFSRNFNGLGIVNTDGSGLRKLFATGFDPAWSPDSRTIAFVRHQEHPFSNELWLLSADGSGQRRLTAGHSDFAPAWSPDGQAIAFVRKPTSGRRRADLYTIRLRDRHVRRLTATPEIDEEAPAWRPAP